MALLSLLSGMPGCNLVACHVNHQLRPEAEEEEMFVLRYAASQGIPCVRERVNVRNMAHTRGIAIEEAAREARQASFLKWAAGYPGALVALAHHRNDQQETALLHLCRGASGIHGMFPVSTWANGLTVVRPMLDFFPGGYHLLSGASPYSMEGRFQQPVCRIYQERPAP